MSPRCRIVYALYLGGYVDKSDILNANQYREVMIYKGLQRKAVSKLIKTYNNIYFHTLSNVSSEVEWRKRLDHIEVSAKKLYAIELQDAQYLKYLNKGYQLNAQQQSIVDMFKILDAAGIIDDDTEVF